MLNVIRTSLLIIILLVVFLKALFLVLYFSSCIPLHAALLSPHFYKPPPLRRPLRLYSTFFSFHPRNIDSSIAHIQTALKHISSWMCANLLALNFSKTEFLIISLTQQLSKIENFSLNTTHSARNLGFIFDEKLTSLIRSHHFLSPAILISENSAVSVLNSILEQPLPLLPLLSTLLQSS